MSKVEKFINEISEADEVAIMEFDFKPCFALMREMEATIKEARTILNRSLLNIYGDNWRDDASIFMRKTEDI